MILALDLGTDTGFALGQDALIASGTQSFRNDRYSGGGMRYLRFRRWLDEMQTTAGLTEIVFEEVRAHRGTDAAHVYGGLMGTLTAWAEEQKIPYEGIPVARIKRAWTGKGNAKKDLMILTCRKHGFAPGDDNEADAIALLHLRLGKYLVA